MRIVRAVAVFLLLVAPIDAIGATKVIKFGRLVDGTGRVVPNAVVLVENDRIQSVTIDHNQYYIENGEVYHFPGDYRSRLSGFIARNIETARRAFKAGAMLVMGSDAVYTGWGLNTRELEKFVAFGMTPEQALQTATKNPAAMLGMEKSLGAVAPGYYADIVAVDGDPLVNIAVVTKNVRWVMKGGQVVVDRTKTTAR